MGKIRLRSERKVREKIMNFQANANKMVSSEYFPLLQTIWNYSCKATETFLSCRAKALSGIILELVRMFFNTLFIASV